MNTIPIVITVPQTTGAEAPVARARSVNFQLRRGDLIVVDGLQRAKVYAGRGLILHANEVERILAGPELEQLEQLELLATAASAQFQRLDTLSPEEKKALPRVGRPRVETYLKRLAELCEAKPKEGSGGGAADKSA